MPNIEDDLEAYDKLKEPSKSIVGRRLLKAASRLTEEIEESRKWLEWADGKLEAKPNQTREVQWIAELRNYEQLCDLRDEVRRRVLLV